MSFIKLKKISSGEAWKIRLMLLGFLGFGLLSVVYYPFDILRNLFPQMFQNENSSCIILNVIGIPCAFCGMSHAFYEFINFNFGKSTYYNPSSVIFFTFLGIICLSIFVLSIFNYKADVTFNSRTLLISFLVLLVIWVLNIFFGHH